jgi:hypothetical protein
MDGGIMNGSSLKLNRVEIFTSDNVNTNNQGIIGIAAAGQVTNIDLKMMDDNFITGGILRTFHSTFGDYIHLQVIDIDNVLGFGTNVVLGQYCTSWYLRDDAQEQFNETTSYPAKIVAGLYLRIVYHSIGQSDVVVTANYRLHKALY